MDGNEGALWVENGLHLIIMKNRTAFAQLLNKLFIGTGLCVFLLVFPTLDASSDNGQ